YIEDLLGDHFVVDRVVGGYRPIIEVARKGALGEFLPVETAVGPLEGRRRAVLREAAFRSDPISDVLDRIVGRRLVSDAAMPGRTRPFHDPGVGPRRAGLGNVFLHVEPRIVFERLAGLRVEALGPVQLVRVLAAIDEAAVAAVE